MRTGQKNENMPIDADFLRAVAPLYDAGMGTELVGPVLYSLVRMARPRRLLEVGLGYTTPFLLQALADSAADHRREVATLAARSEKNLLLPDYYREPYAPVLCGIDDQSHPGSTAGAVAEVVAGMGLEPFLKLVPGDFRGQARSLGAAHLPIDFVWFDCGGIAEYRDFLFEYWGVINPDGGLLVLHSTQTNLTIHSVISRLKLEQATTKFLDFEMVSLLEPHKHAQNSVTLIRFTAGVSQKFYSVEP